MKPAAANPYTAAEPCRLTYRSSAARITSDKVSSLDSAMARAAAHNGSATRTFRSVVPRGMSALSEGAKAERGALAGEAVSEVLEDCGVDALAALGALGADLHVPREVLSEAGYSSEVVGDVLFALGHDLLRSSGCRYTLTRGVGTCQEASAA